MVERRLRALGEGEDVYYSVAKFASRGRRLEDTVPARWLWADLDNVHPSACAQLGVPPTIAIASSPHRFQALWALNRPLEAGVLAKLNRALTYALEADRGGWDLSQVLRVPGTRNWKYPGGPEVQLLWDDGKVYRPEEIYKRVKHLVSRNGSVGGALGAVVSKDKLPARARALLRAKRDQVVRGERSSRLWELECLLAEAGCGEDQIVSLVEPTPWNKWRELATGDLRLRQDVRKAIRHVATKRTMALGPTTAPPPADTERQGEAEVDGDVEPEIVHDVEVSPFVDYASFMATNFEAPRWLVDEVWTAHSHGYIAGDPKTSKSLIAMALGVSVASGKDFLGKYEVPNAGPVLMIQEENVDWVMQDRMRKLARFYGLIKRGDIEVSEERVRGAVATQRVRLDFPQEIPFSMLNNYSFNMATEEHRELVEREIQRVQPALVIFDPLYLMLGNADERNSSQLRPFLQWLLYLRFEYNTGVIIIHHYAQSPTHEGGSVKKLGHRLMGSATLYAWFESAMYCEASELGADDLAGGWNRRVRVDRDFRNVGGRVPLDVRLKMGQPGDLVMDANVTQYNITGEIEALVAGAPGVLISAVAEALGVDKRTALARARVADVKIVGGKRGRGMTWKLYPSGYELELDEDEGGGKKGGSKRR